MKRLILILLFGLFPTQTKEIKPIELRPDEVRDLQESLDQVSIQQARLGEAQANFGAKFSRLCAKRGVDPDVYSPDFQGGLKLLLPRPQVAPSSTPQTK